MKNLLPNNYVMLMFLLINGNEWICSSSANDVYDCDIHLVYNCIINVTNLYGFNLQDPGIKYQMPILNKTDFIQLCSDYKLMRNCLQENEPCDYRGMIYSTYALALAKGLDYACDETVLKDYSQVVNCFGMQEIQATDRGCHVKLFKEIQRLIYETTGHVKTTRIDVSVTVETVCQKLINSMSCIRKKLLSVCGQFVADWYYTVLLNTITPTLNKFHCKLQMSNSNIVILFFVSLAAAAIVCIAVFICIQRYRSFMKSKMNFVLSYIPKANQRIRKFAPSILPKIGPKSPSTTEKKKDTPGVASEAASESNPVAPSSAAGPTSETVPTGTKTDPTTEAPTAPASQPEKSWWNSWWR